MSRVLMAALVNPYPPVNGGQLHLYNTARALNEMMGHEVHFVAVSSREPSDGSVFERQIIQKRTRLVRALNRVFKNTRVLYADGWDRLPDRMLLAKTIRRHYSKGYFDLAIFFRWPAYSKRAAEAAKASAIITADINFERNDSWMARLGCSKLRLAFLSLVNRLYKKRELAAYRSCDYVMAVSERDRAFLAEYGCKDGLMAIPVPVEMSQPLSWNGASDHFDALFVGGGKYSANADGSLFFIEEVLPKIVKRVPGFTFALVGGGQPKSIQDYSSHPNVKLLGYVDDEALTDTYRRSRLVICPLRYGSGVKVKVLEAMSMAKPVVLTPVGAQGIDLINGESASIVDNAEDMASVIVGLLSDEDRRRRMGEAARRVAIQQHSFEAIARRLEEVLAPQSGNGASWEVT